MLLLPTGEAADLTGDAPGLVEAPGDAAAIREEAVEAAPGDMVVSAALLFRRFFLDFLNWLERSNWLRENSSPRRAGVVLLLAADWSCPLCDCSCPLPAVRRSTVPSRRGSPPVADDPVSRLSLLPPRPLVLYW